MSNKALIDPGFPATLDDIAATARGLKVYAHGTTYNGGNAPTVTLSAGGGSLSSVQMGDFIPYQMQDGNWRARFNVAVSLSAVARTVVILNVAGITFAALGGNTPHHAISCWVGVAGIDINATQNTGNLEANFASTTISRISFSGDVKLASKPTWAY